jgi:hypothetical protein
MIALGGVDNAQGRQYAVAPDGRFLINAVLDNSATAPITLLTNWNPEAKPESARMRVSSHQHVISTSLRSWRLAIPSDSSPSSAPSQRTAVLCEPSFSLIDRSARLEWQKSVPVAGGSR